MFERRDTRAVAALVCLVLLAACQSYGGSLYAKLVHQGKAPAATYLVEKYDWLTTAKAETESQAEALSVGEITDEEGDVITTPGSKILAWRCQGSTWQHREYGLSLSGPVTTLQTSCP